MKNLFKITPLLIIIGLLFSCEQEHGGYEKTDSGLYYNIHTDMDGEKPEKGDILKIHIQYATEDSVIFNNRDRRDLPVDIPLTESRYEADINEGLAMMSKGDSASFIIDAESFFEYTAGQPTPDFIEPGSDLYFNVVLVDFMDQEEYSLEQQRISEDISERSEELAQEEKEKLEEYKEKEDIETKPLESGLIYIEKEEGDGKPVEAGDEVEIHYEGRLLDGTVFDSSYKAGQPIEIVIGEGQVIGGWEEGISLMNVGGKATLIIPSDLAYGAQGVQGIIPPFSTLVFDVEITDIK